MTICFCNKRWNLEFFIIPTVPIFQTFFIKNSHFLLFFLDMKLKFLVLIWKFLHFVIDNLKKGEKNYFLKNLLLLENNLMSRRFDIVINLKFLTETNCHCLLGKSSLLVLGFSPSNRGEKKNRENLNILSNIINLARQ